MKVSVIVPAYNAESSLRQSLTSALSQRNVELELICIDDGSTDSTPEIINAMASADARIKPISQSNSGSGTARNAGIDRASGDYIAFLDADDFYPNPVSLSHLVWQAIQTQTPICIGRKTNRSHFFSMDRGLNLLDAQQIYSAGQLSNLFLYQAAIYSRAAIISTGVRFPPYRRFQDPPFFLNAVIALERFSVIEEHVYCYDRRHRTVFWTSDSLRDYLSGVIDAFTTCIRNDLLTLARQLPRLLDEYGFVRSLMRDPQKETLERLANFAQQVNSLNIVPLWFPQALRLSSSPIYRRLPLLDPRFAAASTVDTLKTLL